MHQVIRTNRTTAETRHVTTRILGQ